MKAPKKVRTSLSLFLSVIILSIHAFAQQTDSQNRDGKLLRGEVWQEFVTIENADFYVAENGNDSWSGTLSDPNDTGTDGPFASLKKAKEAVRILKSQLYSPKEDPVETRWIGSPHTFGKGKDILVLIRQVYL